MLNKITVFECDTCKRQIELETDERRPDPSRCAITYKCYGKYSRVGQKNARSSLFPPIVYGLQDYIPRGTVITVAEPTPSNDIISLLSGKSQLVLAATSRKTVLEPPINIDDPEKYVDIIVQDTTRRDDDQIFGFTPGTLAPTEDNILLLDLYELSIDATAFDEYYFIRNENVVQVAGSDDSPSHSVLRFNTTDNITVLLNGVEIPRNSGSVHFTATISGSGEHAIKFTPALVDSNNIIKVFVYKKPADFSDPSKIKSLVFRGLADVSANRTINAWGNVTEVSISNQENGLLDQQRFLYTCTNFETDNKTARLNLNNRYLVKGVRSKGYQFEFECEDVYLVIGQLPYSFSDKVTDLALNIKKSVDDGHVLQYYQDEFSKENIFTEQNNLIGFVESIKPLRTLETFALVNEGADEKNSENTLIDSKYIIGYV